jgi:hypothetical protein
LLDLGAARHLNRSFHVLDYLLQYGLFLAEVTTVVIAIGVW